MLTDSGGVQEETTALGVPCLTLRDNTERPITSHRGHQQAVGSNPDRAAREVDEVLAGRGSRRHSRAVGRPGGPRARRRRSELLGRVNVLFDVVHPAHVDFFQHMIRGLEKRGHRTRIVAREKDVTNVLLDRLGFSYEKRGSAPVAVRHGWRAARRDLALAKVARAFRPDLIVTRNPAGRASRTPAGHSRGFRHRHGEQPAGHSVRRRRSRT